MMLITENETTDSRQSSILVTVYSPDSENAVFYIPVIVITQKQMPRAMVSTRVTVSRKRK